MKRIPIHIYLIFIILILCSCLSHQIVIKKDGTAHVEIHILRAKTISKGDTVAPNYSQQEFTDLKRSLTVFYNTDMITNYQHTALNETNEARVEFDISNVDSLGSYLDPLYGSKFSFVLTDNRLLIIGSDGMLSPEDDPTGISDALAVDLTIVFEKEIKKIKTKNNYVDKLDGHTIKIKTTIGDMDFNGIGNRIEILFK